MATGTWPCCAPSGARSRQANSPGPCSGSAGSSIRVSFRPALVYRPGAGILQTAGVPLALVWSILVLGSWESRTGSTPGKRLLGLTVVTETGLRAPLRACLLRRLSLLAGPFAWLDWLPILG